MKIFNVASAENDVFVDLISRLNGTFSRPSFRTEGSNFSEGDRTLIRIDGIQNSLISYFRL